MTPEELADAVTKRVKIAARASNRILGAGAVEYYDEHGDGLQRFEKMSPPQLIRYMKEEAEDFINYGVMLSILLDRIEERSDLLLRKIKEHTPTIVCLCGSTRFKDEYVLANAMETMLGKIVLSVGVFKADFTDSEENTLTEKERAALDRLHLQKIDLADEVLFLNVGGYMGESTMREYEYAVALGKRIRFLEPDKAPKGATE